MKNISKISIKSVIASVGALLNVVIFPSIAHGLGQLQTGALAAKSADQPANLFGMSGIFATISNTAMFLVGALSVLMLVYGGFRYTISGGDSAKVTAAKNTILYAIVGVVVAMLAYAAINFVTSSLTGGSAGGTNV